jgi:hypothetical protein
MIDRTGQARRLGRRRETRVVSYRFSAPDDLGIPAIRHARVLALGGDE